MLQQLYIQNIALIDEMRMDFEKGFNVLTGETGAGKSIIIDSISAVLGFRFSKDLIRTGTDKSLIEASFNTSDASVIATLQDLGIEPEEDGTIILTRENWKNGRNSCRINGRISTVSNLKSIGEKLLDIHGQHDNQSLLRVDTHIDLLDSFGGKELLDIKAEYNELLTEYKELWDKLSKLSYDTDEREKRIDFLKFQIDEINNSRLIDGEEEELEARRVILCNAENIIRALSIAYELLFSGSGEFNSKPALDTINMAVEALGKIEEFSENYKNILGRMEEAVYQLQDISEEIRKERELIDYDPQELEEIDERLDLIYKLKRKYGKSIKDILEYCRIKEKELNDLLSHETIIKELKKQLSEVEKRLFMCAEKLNIERVKASEYLEEKITQELHDLEMKRARFKVNIEFDTETDKNSFHKYTSKGLNKVEFLISPNAGEPLKPLHKIASGGEMSRIMLAIKTILADVDNIPVLIFDEIDSGVSGHVAQKVGEKLALLSKKHQVICITHLAQIACMADNHFYIEKVMEKSTTKTHVRRLTPGERKEGLAKLLGGVHISDITLRHAEEMLQQAEKFKMSNV